jgi:hypothetical protein
LRLFAVYEFHAIGFEGGDDLLAVSTRPSTIASPALTDNGRIVGDIGCYDVGLWRTGSPTMFLKAWPSTSTR